jgi:hypothetical protein
MGISRKQVVSALIAVLASAATSRAADLSVSILDLGRARLVHW